jgi:hypothetical protein
MNNIDNDDNFYDLDDDLRDEEPETFEVRLPENDNAGPKRKKRKHQFGPSAYTRERIATMLAVAGFDAERIPVERRLTALWVVWCFQKKIFDAKTIAECIERPLSWAVTSMQDLRVAAKPGTEVG